MPVSAPSFRRLRIYQLRLMGNSLCAELRAQMLVNSSAAFARLESDELPLTHEFLGRMLGVPRPGVTIARQALERVGLIATSALPPRID